MIAATIAIALLSLTPGHQTSASWLDQEADRFLNETGYPGVWVAVARQGKVIAVSARGQSDLQSHESARIDNRVRIGSVSKPVLAAIAGWFVQEGSIRYTDRLLDVVTSLAASANPGYASVDLAMLLTHQAGIVKDQRASFPRPPSPSTYGQIRLTEVQKTLANAPLFVPGSSSAYSNYGYQAAAVMLETRLGKSYEVLLKEVLRDRAGLSSVGTGVPPTSPTSGHSTIDGLTIVSPPAKTHFAYDYGAFGSVHLTISDLAKFGLLYMPGSPLFSRQTLQILCAEQQGPYTLAAFLADRKDPNAITLHHNGSLTVGRGDSTVLWVNPARGIVVAAYTNIGNKGSAEVDALKNLLVRPLYWRLANTR